MSLEHVTLDGVVGAGVVGGDDGDLEGVSEGVCDGTNVLGRGVGSGDG